MNRDEFHKAVNIIKELKLDLSDEEIERIVVNLSTPSKYDMEKSIEKVLKQIKKETR
jgi:flagellin-specific chaperone FliS